MKWIEGYPRGFRGENAVWVVCEFQRSGWGQRYETYKWDGRTWDKPGIEKATRWAFLTPMPCPAPNTKCNRNRRGECCNTCEEKCEQECQNDFARCKRWMTT